MHLENFSDELILTTFEFLKIEDLIHSFHGLNRRFNGLLPSHFIQHGVDLRALRPDYFNVICDQYLASTCDRINSLNIAQNNNSSETLQKMLGKELPLSRFIGLKSLTLSYLSPRDLMDIVRPALPFLTELTHLKLVSCKLAEPECEDLSTALALINSIWSLPNLKYCIFNNTCVYQSGSGMFVEPTVISSSLIYLSTDNLDAHTYDLTQISRCTPNLKHVSVDFSCSCPPYLLNKPAVSITSFELTLLDTKMSDFEETLKYLPNLRRLIVKGTPYFDGYKWESIITQYLRSLRELEFHMTMSYDTTDQSEQQIDRILNAFRTPFWLEQHQWFVTCESNSEIGRINIFTVPFHLKTFQIFGNSRWKSTYPTNKQIEMDAAVRSLEFCASPSEEFGPCEMQLHKIEKLTVGFPLNDRFWSMISKFDSVKTINIPAYDGSEQSKSQLQRLLTSTANVSLIRLCNYAFPHEYSETVRSVKNFPFDLNSSRIELQGLGSTEPLTEECCREFSHSTLASHCDELHISVKNRKSVCDIVRTMKHLRVLCVRCEEPLQPRTESDGDNRVAAKTELIAWLKQDLEGIRELIEIFDYYDRITYFDCVMLRMSPIK